MPTRIDYAALADEYARHRTVHPGVLARLIEFAPTTTSGSILEVGCGTGNYSRALQQAIRCELIGIDPSREMLSRARAQPTRISWLLGRAEGLPLATNSVDLVYSVDVIHHIADRKAYWREARRVLRPGGKVVTVTDSASDIARRRPLSSHFPETVAHEMARYPPVELIAEEKQEAGFTDIQFDHVQLEYDLTSIEPYRERVFSALRLISEEAFQSGLSRLATDLAAGALRARSLYTLIIGIAAS